RPRAQLGPQAGLSEVRAVLPGPDPERVQPAGADQLLLGRLRHRRLHRYHDPDESQPGLPRALQSVHGAARGGCELAQGPFVRKADLPVRLSDAADVRLLGGGPLLRSRSVVAPPPPPPPPS